MKPILPLLLLATSLSLPAFADDATGKAGYGRPHGGPMHAALAKLPDAKADEIRSAMKESYAKNKPLAEKAHAIAEEKRTLLSAEKFDRAAFEKKQSEEREVQGEMRAAGDSAFADAVAKLDAKDRRTLAENMQSRRGHGERKDDAGGAE